MKELSVDLYDQQERAARISASYPALRAFYPAAFASANFPMRVEGESELRRYADIMYETISRKEWLEEKLYSAKEAESIIRLSNQIERLTARLFNDPVQPLMCLFPPIELLRVIEALSATINRRLTVVEIGPGSGYLSAYLLNLGHRVIAVDICQSLYLWQNRLFSDYALDEWAFADAGSLPKFSNAQVIHIPWWHYASLYENPTAAADIVVCDAALGEMDHFGFRYFIEITKALTAKSPIGCFLYQNAGEQRFQRQDYIAQYAVDRGFRFVESGGISIFACSNQFPADFLKGSEKAPPLGGGNGMLAPAKFLTIQSEKWLESYRFFDFIGLGR